jgi:formylmethanofuran dehydrogenase subunit E
MNSPSQLLEASAALHRHLCPRQVLGVRMGLLAGEVLGLDLSQTDKRLLTVVETDGCASDGIAVATNYWVGRRTMRVEDYGKVAATFVDTATGRAIRVSARPGIRQRARDCAPEARNKWEAQLLGYQRMPSNELLSAQGVQLKMTISSAFHKLRRQPHLGHRFAQLLPIFHFGGAVADGFAQPAPGLRRAHQFFQQVGVFQLEHSHVRGTGFDPILTPAFDHLDDVLRRVFAGATQKRDNVFGGDALRGGGLQ